MTGIKIGSISEEDLPSLGALYAELTGEPTLEQQAADEFRRIAANADYVLLGAWLDGQLVGTVMGLLCRKLSRDSRPALLLENFVVGEAFRRRGIGTALFMAMERIARERGCASIMLISSAKRAGAHAFYAAHGYADEKVFGFKKKIEI